MGNENRTVSRFAEGNHWLSLAQTARKELIQNKLSREIVERHQLPGVEVEQVKADQLIFQWRREGDGNRPVVQLFEVRHQGQEEELSCTGVCTTPARRADLYVYTENIFKLYELNPKVPLSETEQLRIFCEVVQGMEVLALKFGEFLPGKDSVGYNIGKRGRAWINDNFCCNEVQIKKVVCGKQERSKWERQVLETFIDYCKLCTTDYNSHNCKFYSVIELIKRNKLHDFNALKEFQNRKVLAAKKAALELQNASNQAELASSQLIVSSNEFISTEAMEQNRKTDRINANKTFEIGTRRQGGERIKIDGPYRSTYQQPKHQIKFVGSAQHLKPNYVQVRKKQFNSFVSQGRSAIQVLPQRVQPQLFTIKQAIQKPAHYDQLQQLYDSRSSRSQSKMIKKENIKLVDSWVVMQDAHQSSNQGSFFRHKPTVLQQSIILKAPKNHRR